MRFNFLCVLLLHNPALLIICVSGWEREDMVEFEWDENKRQATLLERGIDFIDAVLIWDDPFRQERVDTRKSYGEIRYQTIGRSPLGILFVVYTTRFYTRGKQINRLISVRPAKKKEVEQYNNHTFSIGLAI